MQALERAMAELVLGRAIPANDPYAVEEWLSRNRVSSDDADALRKSMKELSVYRTLVRERLCDAVTLAIPRTRARLGTLFDEYFERFLAEHGPRTHYLRDVTTEFLEFIAPLVESDSRVPPWALDLARHEALEIFVASLVDEPRTGTLPELDPDRGLSFSLTARIVRYGFAVHRLPDDPNDVSEPERAETALFVYRSEEHDVRYLELTRLAARILERLLAGETLRRALDLGTHDEGVLLDATVLEGTARVLADLAERGAVLGAKEAEKAAPDLQMSRETAETAGAAERKARNKAKRTG
jgi:hypothetical protein